MLYKTNFCSVYNANFSAYVTICVYYCLMPVRAYNKIICGCTTRARWRKLWTDNIKDILIKHCYCITETTHLAFGKKAKASTSTHYSKWWPAALSPTWGKTIDWLTNMTENRFTKVYVMQWRKSNGRCCSCDVKC